jgi:phenylpropionate dioxygenase-like ring-hydroxylating dioxygenase large terminal subunit
MTVTTTSSAPSAASAASAPSAPAAATGKAGEVSDAEVDALVSRGIRDRWYPVCPSSWVGREPIGLHRAGEELVLWRTDAGDVHVLEDRCPHRGVPLSLGRPSGDGAEAIACRYHGVVVDGGGLVLSVPGQPGCALEGRRAGRSFPVVEHAGAVFVWFGNLPASEPVPFSTPEELHDPSWSWMLCYVEWNTPARFALENVLDPMHGAYLHRESHSMSEGSQTADFRALDTPHGFRVEKTDQSGVNFDWAELVDDSALYLRLAIPYPPSAGPGGPFFIIGATVPIADDRCGVFFWRCRQVSGWQRSVWRFLYRNRLEGRHWTVLEQDREMLEAMALDADRKEMLYKHDLGVIRIRKHLRRAARAQLAARREA